VQLAKSQNTVLRGGPLITATLKLRSRRTRRRAACCVVFAATCRNTPQFSQDRGARGTAQSVRVNKFTWLCFFPAVPVCGPVNLSN